MNLFKWLRFFCSTLLGNPQQMSRPRVARPAPLSAQPTDELFGRSMEAHDFRTAFVLVEEGRVSQSMIDATFRYPAKGGYGKEKELQFLWQLRPHLSLERWQQVLPQAIAAGDADTVAEARARGAHLTEDGEEELIVQRVANDLGVYDPDMVTYNYGFTWSYVAKAQRPTTIIRVVEILLNRRHHDFAWDVACRWGRGLVEMPEEVLRPLALHAADKYYYRPDRIALVASHLDPDDQVLVRRYIIEHCPPKDIPVMLLQGLGAASLSQEEVAAVARRAFSHGGLNRVRQFSQAAGLDYESLLAAL